MRGGRCGSQDTSPGTARTRPASRFAAGYLRIPALDGPAEPVRDAVLDIVRTHGLAAAVMGTDATIARLRTLELEIPTVPEMGPPLDCVVDKYALIGACGAAGVAYPPTWLADDPGIPFDEPVIVKPRQSAVGSASRVVSHTGAIVARTPGEAARAVRAIREWGLDPIIQRRVERCFKVNVSIIRRAGCTSFRFAYRVLREYPVEGGIAAAVETVAADTGIGAMAIEAAERVCDAAGYAGLANVEFYGQADGRLCLIEVNARAWGSLGFPAQLGLEPAERAVRDALRLPPEEPIPYPTGRRWHRPMLELKWLAARSSERSPRRQILGSRPWDAYDIVSIRDPMPMAFAAGAAIGRGLGLLRRAVTSRA